MLISSLESGFWLISNSYGEFIIESLFSSITLSNDLGLLKMFFSSFGKTSSYGVSLSLISSSCLNEWDSYLFSVISLFSPFFSRSFSIFSNFNYSSFNFCSASSFSAWIFVNIALSILTPQ